MWVEIIATSVTTATAAHLVPKVCSLLARRFTKPYEKSPTPQNLPLGDYIKSAEKLEYMSEIKINVAPAIQHTVLGEEFRTQADKDLDVSNLPEIEIDLEPSIPFSALPPDYAPRN